MDPVELTTLLGAGLDHPAIRQTHISRVFLTQDRAYKRLKPVRFDFLDFSTREARYVHLANEARLNRRLAADVYRRLVPVWQQGTRSRVEGSGPPDDWLLEMTRLPDEATLQATLVEKRLSQRQFGQVLDLLVGFFRAAARSAEITANGHPSILRQNLVENFGVFEGAADEGALEPLRVRRLRSAQLGRLERLDDELRCRMADGWIRDGHGDLRAEHVYLMQPPRIIDCIAFNHRLRWIDVADDLSFLVTDLIRLGGADWADRLIDGYRTGMSDPVSDELFAYYRSYRFAVRAKVALLRGRELPVGDALDQSARHAAETFDLSLEELAAVRPWIVAVCGLSGTGKSTLAAALADRIGAVRLSSDLIRKALFRLKETERTADPALYGPAANERTYAEMSSQADRLIQGGVSAVLDATFLGRQDRDRLVAQAEATGVAALFVECRCPDSEIERRLAERASRGDDPSDATLDVWHRQRTISDGYAGLAADDHLVVDSTGPIEKMLDEIVSRLKGR